MHDEGPSMQVWDRGVRDRSRWKRGRWKGREVARRHMQDSFTRLGSAGSTQEAGARFRSSHQACPAPRNWTSGPEHVMPTTSVLQTAVRKPVVTSLQKCTYAPYGAHPLTEPGSPSHNGNGDVVATTFSVS